MYLKARAPHTSVWVTHIFVWVPMSIYIQVCVLVPISIKYFLTSCSHLPPSYNCYMLISINKFGFLAIFTQLSHHSFNLEIRKIFKSRIMDWRQSPLAISVVVMYSASMEEGVTMAYFFIHHAIDYIQRKQKTSSGRRKIDVSSPICIGPSL